MKSLLNQKLQLAIFTHFSKLFISLLLKVSSWFTVSVFTWCYTSGIPCTECLFQFHPSQSSRRSPGYVPPSCRSVLQFLSLGWALCARQSSYLHLLRPQKLLHRGMAQIRARSLLELWPVLFWASASPGLGSRSQFSYPLLMLQIRYCRWSVAPVGQPCYKLDGRKEGWFLRKRDEELSSGKWASQIVPIICDGVILPAGVLEDQSVSSDRSRTGVKFVTDYLLLWWIREHIINLSSDEQGWVYALARTGVSYAPQCYAVGWEQ